MAGCGGGGSLVGKVLSFMFHAFVFSFTYMEAVQEEMRADPHQYRGIVEEIYYLIKG